MANLFIEGARAGKNTWWRWLLVAAFTVVSTFGLMIAVLYVMREITGIGVRQLLTTPVADMAITLASLGLFLPILALFSKLFHKRPIRSLFTVRANFDWKRFFFSAGVLLAANVLVDLIAFALMPGNYRFSYTPTVFWPSLIVALLLLPLQTGAEELVFRSYLLQGVSLLTRRPWIGIALTSLVFSLLHIGNPEIIGHSLLLILPQYGIFAIAMAVVTLVDESLEAAWGAHFINNFYAFMLLGYPDFSVGTGSLFMLRELKPLVMLIQAIFVSSIFLFALLWKKRGLIRSRLGTIDPVIAPAAAALPAAELL